MLMAAQRASLDYCRICLSSTISVPKQHRSIKGVVTFVSPHKLSQFQGWDLSNSSSSYTFCFMSEKYNCNITASVASGATRKGIVHRKVTRSYHRTNSLAPGPFEPVLSKRGPYRATTNGAKNKKTLTGSCGSLLREVA